MAIVPFGLNIYEGQKLYRTTLDSGVWGNQQTVFEADNSDPDSFALNFTAGGITKALATTQGIVVNRADATGMIFCGNGDVAKIISFPTQGGTNILATNEWGNPWAMSVGAYYWRGRYFLFIIVITGGGFNYRHACISTGDYGTTWIEEDASNSPTINRSGGFIANRWDGVASSVYSLVTPDRFDYFLYKFDMTTRTWSVASPALNVVGHPGSQVVDNGFIAIFDNGDIGVVNTLAGSLGVSYHLLSGGVWSAQTDIRPVTYSFEAGVQDGETIHCFGYPTAGSKLAGSGVYWRLDHLGTTTSDLFTFPPTSFPTVTSDGFGRGIVVDGVLMIPHDYSTDSGNAVWVGDASGFSLVRQVLPGPLAPDILPSSCIQLYYYAPIIDFVFPEFVKRAMAPGN